MIRVLLALSFLCATLASTGCRIRVAPATSSVVFVIDASDSIPSERRGEVIAYVNRCSKQRGQGDRVGVVTFGNAANTEVFLIPEQFRIPDRFENPVTTTASDIGSGIERAISMLDSHGRRRIVLITDGNETHGNALAAAGKAVEKGIDIDLIPIRFEKHDAVVQAAVSPATVSIGEAFEINIAAQSTSDLSPGEGVLRVDVHSAHGVKTIDRRPVSLTTDLQTFSLQHRFDGIEDVGEVEATFLPAATSRDDVPWNSTAAIPVGLKSPQSVLVLVRHEHHERISNISARSPLTAPRTFDLRDVSQWRMNRLSQLQHYDAIVLVDLTRGSDINQHQERLLVTAAESFGVGLVMMGGRNGFESWGGSDLEDALAVRFATPPTLATAVILLGSEKKDDVAPIVAARQFVKSAKPEHQIGFLRSGKWLGLPGMHKAGNNRSPFQSALGHALNEAGTRRYDPTRSEVKTAFQLAAKELTRVRADRKRILLIGGVRGSLHKGIASPLQAPGVEVIAVEKHRSTKSEIERIGGRHFDLRAKRGQVVRELAEPVPTRFTRQHLTPTIADATHPILQDIHQLLPVSDASRLQIADDTRATELARVEVETSLETYSIPALVAGQYGSAKTVTVSTDAFEQWSRSAQYDSVLLDNNRTIKDVQTGWQQLLSNTISWASRKPTTSIEFETALHGRDLVVSIPTPQQLDTSVTCSIVGPVPGTAKLRLQQEDGVLRGRHTVQGGGVYSVVTAIGGQVSLPTNVFVGSAEDALRENETLLVEIARLQHTDGRLGRILELSAAARNNHFQFDAP